MADTIQVDSELAIKLAKEYLAGTWLGADKQTVSLKILSGGYCSTIYVCEDTSGNCEPAKFLIRITGGRLLKDDDPVKSYNEGTESIVFFMHGHLGYGPKLYGIFKGGRLEEYIPSRMLNDTDLEDVNIRKQIARKLARFHSMKLPVSKKIHPSLDLLVSVYRDLELPENRLRFLQNSELCGIRPGWEKQLDFYAEVDFLKDTLKKVGGRPVISICDMNKNNCLIRDSPDKFGEVVTLLDYEVGGTNWRGYDIANHFIVWMTDFSKPDMLSRIPFPEDKIRREFVAEYLQLTKTMGVFEDFDENGLDSVEHVVMEVDLLVLSVLLVIVHLVVLKLLNEDNPISQNRTEVRKFYSVGRMMMNFYAEHKVYFIERYGHSLSKNA